MTKSAPLDAARPSRLDVAALRADFPILGREVRGGVLAYLDNAATTQKPRAVIDAVSRYYEHTNANIHRGLHQLSEEATAAYEAARANVARFLGAASPTEIVFTRGTTEAINLVAQSWGRQSLRAGDEVVLTEMEHHSNLVPWQMLREQLGIRLRIVPIDDHGALRMEELEPLLGPRTKLVALCHVSNALGTVNPLRDIVAMAKAHGAKVLVDGAQAVPHTAVDVARIGCDFYAFSGHKVYGPTGIGALWARRDLLEAMPPWQGGGEMIRMVTLDRVVYADVPQKFEAGTPNIAGAIGLGAALDYVRRVGLQAIADHEDDLLTRATDRIGQIPGVHILGRAPVRAGVLSFVLENVHAHDLGTILDEHGIAIRSGHHCAMPVMERFGVPASARASFGLYNTREEVDRLVEAVAGAQEVLA